MLLGMKATRMGTSNNMGSTFRILKSFGYVEQVHAMIKVNLFHELQILVLSFSSCRCTKKLPCDLSITFSEVKPLSAYARCHFCCSLLRVFLIESTRKFQTNKFEFIHRQFLFRLTMADW